MDQHGKNKLKMYQSVEAICTATPADWNGLPAFVTFFAQFTAKLNALEQASYDQSIAIVGIAAQKEQLLQSTVAQAELIAAALRSYAAAANDPVLSGQLKFTKWSFSRGGGQAVLEHVDSIVNNANAHVASLSDYGIHQADINALGHLRSQLGDVLGAPRNAIVGRKHITATMALLFREIDVLLKEHLDRLIEILKPAHPDFYLRFKGARIIVDYKGKQASPKDE